MDCHTWPELSGSDWGERLLAPIKGQRYPLSGSIDLTERCNLACHHCYIRQPVNSKNALAREMNTGKAINIIDQIADAGCMFLMLTGGEIFVRPDFFDIYIHAKQRGLILTLFTNGTLVTEEIADRLANSPPTIIEISLYGATEETYTAITGVRGSYKRVINGINLLLDRGLNVMLKTVLTKRNLHEFDQMKHIAEDYNVQFRYDGMLWPRLDGNIKPNNERIPIDELLTLDVKDPERLQKWIELFNENSKQFTRSEYVYNCGAGFRSFHVNAAGRLTMCIMTRKPAYDLSEMTFKEAWDKLGEERLRKRILKTECETCPLGALCAQCPGWSQAEHGDFETPSKYVCEIAKKRVAKLSKYRIINEVEEKSYDKQKTL